MFVGSFVFFFSSLFMSAVIRYTLLDFVLLNTNPHSVALNYTPNSSKKKFNDLRKYGFLSHMKVCDENEAHIHM